MNSCNNCGFPFEPSKTPICPKCQIDGDTGGYKQVLEIDVAHSGETWGMAREKIIAALDLAIYGNHKALKIIHGYGSLGGEAIIAPQAVSLMRHLAEQNNARFSKDNKNPGVSIIWLNRSRTQKTETERMVDLYNKSTTKKESFGGNWFEQAMKKRH